MNRHDLLEAVNLPDLISMLAGGDAVRGLTRERGGVICDPRPGCTERSPSFSVYRQGAVWLWKRHGGDAAHGSAFDLLLAFGYSRPAAWEELARLAGVPLDAWTPGRPAVPVVPRDPLAEARSALSRCAPLSHVDVSRARSFISSLQEGDGASCELLTRGLLDWPGLQIGKLRRDHTAQDGRVLAHAGALAFMVRGPDGLAWGLKVRNVYSGDGRTGHPLNRYVYRIGGHGAPAWCSPEYGTGNALLIVEGELNGAAAARALESSGECLDVQGLAGAGGTPFIDGMNGRTVYVYADPDAPGRECVQRVGRLAHAAGARAVRVLTPLTAGDFCEVAGERGVEGLGTMLLNLLHTSTIHHTVPPHGGSAPVIPPHHHSPRAGVVVDTAMQKYRARLGKKLGGTR